MTTGQAFLEKHMPALHTLCRQYGVQRLYAFGSVLQDTFSEESDVDLLVKFEHSLRPQDTDSFLDLYEKLQSLFGREVDLLTVEQLQNPYFIAQLNRTAKRIYG